MVYKWHTEKKWNRNGNEMEIHSIVWHINGKNGTGMDDTKIVWSCVSWDANGTSNLLGLIYG